MPPGPAHEPAEEVGELVPIILVEAVGGRLTSSADRRRRPPPVSLP
ncbi:MAG TPA: hypothetical protein VMU75_08255 [Acidimicrobiales bacterium]|nr:hypothetical protein [Acidimicrobiales bacterium]